MAWLNRIRPIGWVGICIGIALVIVMIAAATGGLKPHGELPQSCYDAQNAESIANDPNQSESAQQVASDEYAVKAQQCEDDGGEVPGD